jgi:hypothetical protein
MRVRCLAVSPDIPLHYASLRGPHARLESPPVAFGNALKTDR